MAYSDPNKKKIGPAPKIKPETKVTKVPGNDLREHATHNPNGVGHKPSKKK